MGLVLSSHSSMFADGDTGWVLICAALVLLMTPGVAFFYGGLVHRKNALSILIQCFLAVCITTVVWVVLGYTIAFGPATLGGFIGDLQYMLLGNMEHADHLPKDPHKVARSPLFMIFMMMFAIIAPAIIVGGFAERMKLLAFALFLPLWTLVVYCPVTKWIWGNDPGASGFFDLGNGGSLDFAGGTVVHFNAGIAALVAALVIGRRTSFGEKKSLPHSIPFCMLGGALLWFGWFGFNGGSAGAPDRIAVLAFMNTQVSAAAGGLSWILLEWFLRGRPTSVGLVTGAVAGLVGITPACGYVDTSWALVIGCGSTAASFFAVNRIKKWFTYDDSLDAFGIHGISGLWGAIATGLFASLEINPDGRNGLFYGNPEQLWLQIKPVIYVTIWSGGCTWILLLLLKHTIGIRASAEHERIGLDFAEQSLLAYDSYERTNVSAQDKPANSSSV